MTRRVIITAVYKSNAHAAFLSAIDPRELSKAMSGLARYKGLPDGPFQEGKTYKIDATTWKIIKTKNYEMFIEHLDKEACVLRSREKGGAIQRWDHCLSIRQEDEMAVWTDDVIIDAGLMTSVFTRFAAYMYKRRHKHRKALSITIQTAHTVV